ncbi:PDZ domain-containing protein, partial [bacterium]|nr:PDZ domain-containing protein [bacterium]
AGPLKHWFDQSNADMRMTQSIYLATLQQDIPSPLAKESDEEKGTDTTQADDGKKKEEKKPLKIDFDGLTYRIVALPVPAGDYSSLQAGVEGQLFYLENPPQQEGPGPKGGKLHRFDLKKREDKIILDGLTYFKISQDKKKILFRSGEEWTIAELGDEIKKDKGKLKTDGIEVRIEPRQEWKQIFDEAWRINRDYFYATNMHGADWPAMREKYGAFLPDVPCRTDLNRLIQWMCSELSVGHSYLGGGDFLNESKKVPVGLLGADYVLKNSRYQFSKVYGGLNWTPDLRSPLKEPGIDVREGEYILSVNGRELTANMNLYTLFENTAGKIVEITVGPNPGPDKARTLKVVPLEEEYALRNRDWVEGNVKKVDDATGGRVAYVYVPNTAGSGHDYFKRYFFPQAQKDALIIDERFNGGGSLPDYYIDIMRRPLISYWNTRHGRDFKTPTASIQGPKAMIIDETAGSGGDLLPWMFRKFNIGKLIGKRTWGGLVGILGFPELMDGGYITAPNLAIWTEDGWVVENEGVPPDIEVEQWPGQVTAGRDPQLEKAIQVVMEELKKNPVIKPSRPPYPVRVRQEKAE